ncbi:MAG: peptidoglycan bridge formation glycyltransferase FemA/FemB family protein [Oscillospiraceae bacterium]
MLKIYEILNKNQYDELDSFVEGNQNGSFMQCSLWGRVKKNWGFEAVVVRDESLNIIASAAVLIQKIPLINTCFLYAPRGPVCDFDNAEALWELKKGIDELAKKYNCHSFKMDPDALMENTKLIGVLKELGFSQSFGPDGFEGIQARFNYRLYLKNRSEEELMANLTQSCRRKLRIAMKSGVTIEVCGRDMLPRFHEIMEVTGKRDNFNIRPLSYFEGFLDALGEHARLYMGFYQGEPVCGAITTNYSGKVSYVYGASDNRNREVMPNYLMQWEMIKWAVETNCAIYDFQGVSGNLSPENNPMFGLYQFKNGFNGSLDELCGEFDYTYKPLSAKLTQGAISLNSHLKKMKKAIHKKEKKQ